jgi:alternate signal-mediated exported protein
MDKSIKGAVAATAAGVLLVGGLGSLAYWNATADFDGGTISSGKLALTDTGLRQWQLNGIAIGDISTVTLVPGDELALYDAVTLVAEGDNLHATADVTEGSASGTLSPYLNVASEIDLDGTRINLGGTTTDITEADNGSLIEASAVITFPFGTEVDNASQSQTVDLSDFEVTLTQTDPTP